ncbi:hypothetical protein Rhe02_52160 [Rhizocola hellebori]|uniref:Uncharacterized protein n=1 Tax=Rhizocola hellebori TaxID=1392758 RepID=A0A8J3VH83_9ACTN|nr:hypothetical protein Rhe02_52160 [Rhizocola hellebori]
MFLTENQAGTAVCLLLAGVLLLIGIQGTPLIRFGSGEHSFELDTARRTEEIAERVAEVAAADPEQAEALLEGFLTANPAALSEPRMKEVQRLVYEQQLHNVLADLAPNGVGDHRFSDFTIPMTQGRNLYVEVHFAFDEDERHRNFRRRKMNTIVTDLHKDRSGGGFIVITNSASVSLQLTEFVESAKAQFTVDPRPVVVVAWRDSSDNEQLAAAINSFEIDSSRNLSKTA